MGKMERLKSLIIDLADVKRRMKEDAKVKDDVERDTVELFTELDRKTVSVDGVPLSATLVEGSRIVIGWEELQKKLTAKQWNSITTRQPDKNLLEEAIANGDIDPNIVAQCSEEVPNKAYIRINDNREEESKPDPKDELRRAMARKPGRRKKMNRG